MSNCCVAPYTGVCPAYNTLLYLPRCDTITAGSGALCNGDGECGTSNGLNNCQTWDVYTRIVCPEPPASPSPPPSPPPINCPGDMVYNDCGSSCNSTCTQPNPMCTMQCVSRCECPIQTPVWHDHLGSCGTTSECLTPPTSAAPSDIFLDSPCAAYLHVNDESPVNASSYFHTGVPKLSMFTSNIDACCSACNSFNFAKPPPPPVGPPPPNSPPGSVVYHFPGGVDMSPKACHAIAVYNTAFGFSCRFYDQRTDGSMGFLVAPTPTVVETLSYTTSTRWYTLPFPPPSTAPPPPGPNAAPSTIALADGCPKTSPSAGDSCANNSFTGACAYDFYCCPDGGTCMNLTTAICNESTWQIAVATIMCPDSSPFEPPTPPTPPTPGASGIGPAVIVSIAIAGAVAVVVAGAGLYTLVYRGAEAVASTSAGSTKPLLAQAVAPSEQAAATLPPWTFKSLSVR